jgi:hypothetical protein
MKYKTLPSGHIELIPETDAEFWGSAGITLTGRQAKAFAPKATKEQSPEPDPSSPAPEPQEDPSQPKS